MPSYQLFRCYVSQSSYFMPYEYFIFCTNDAFLQNNYTSILNNKPYIEGGLYVQRIMKIIQQTRNTFCGQLYVFCFFMHFFSKCKYLYEYIKLVISIWWLVLVANNLIKWAPDITTTVFPKLWPSRLEFRRNKISQ